MDHKTFLAQMPPDRTAALTHRSNRAGLLHLAGHLTLILTTGTAIALNAPLWPLLMLAQGVFIIFLFTLEHETTHQTPFANRTLNEIVGHGAGLLIFLPLTWFRYFHLAHHRHTNDPDHDPELLAGHKPDCWKAYLLHVTGYGYWTGVGKTLFTNAFGTIQAPYIPNRATRRLRTEARLYLAVYALIALSLTQSQLLLWTWLIPILLGQPFLRLYLLAEHSRCPQVADMLDNTRTTFTTRFVRFIAWNMPYHTEHHTMPNVPFHQLPNLHNDMATALKHTAPSYTAFTKSYAASLRPPKAH